MKTATTAKSPENKPFQAVSGLDEYIGDVSKTTIKTIRRQGYGYPDDEYFFLKLIDSSRQEYVRNVPSHRICD